MNNGCEVQNACKFLRLWSVSKRKNKISTFYAEKFRRTVPPHSHPSDLLLLSTSKRFNELIKIVPKIKLVEGFPDDLYMVNGHTNSLVILDDLMCQCSSDQRVSDLFTRGSHHRGLTVMYLTQNLFPPGKLSRTISLNSHYMIVFKNPRDSREISTLARQMYPHNTNFLLQSFQDATKKPYGYLLLDLHQLTPENMRLRTNILPGEKQIVYVKRT